MTELVAAVVTGVLGWALRWLAHQRQWKRVREIARAELDSSSPINDPEIAIEKALLSTERKRIRTESLTLSPTRPRKYQRAISNTNVHSQRNGEGHKQ